jgi:transforming growth factor-beta-induced protein
MKKKITIIPVMLLAAVFLFSSCSKEEDTPVLESKNIVEVAQEAGSFSLLIQAASNAGLADFLSQEDDLTVFAPTDDAFVALLSELGISSLDDIPAADLAQILSYHVIDSKVMSGDLSTDYVTTLASYGSSNISMYVTVDNGVFINGSVKVTTADVEADNGVIHVVDKVILPPTVVNHALANENFTTLVQAVIKAGLAEALSSEGPFTVFAPTNAAFDALFAQLRISGIDALSAEQLVPILTYHVVSGKVMSTDLTNTTVGTLNEGKSIKIDLTDGVKINESRVITADIVGSNGVIHVIDSVLLP